jgi:hypothetical protein
VNGVSTAGQGRVERRAQGDLAQVVELILDKGLVIDVFAKVSLIGIEILTIDARIVVASVDTYLRYAEATNRLDLHEKGGKGLTDLMGGGGSDTSRSKKKRGSSRHRAIAKGVLEGGKEFVSDLREERRARRDETR